MIKEKQKEIILQQINKSVGKSIHFKDIAIMDIMPNSKEEILELMNELVEEGCVKKHDTLVNEVWLLK